MHPRLAVTRLAASRVNTGASTCTTTKGLTDGILDFVIHAHARATTAAAGVTLPNTQAQIGFDLQSLDQMHAPFI